MMRVVVRRWRLWWRYQLRVLRWRVLQRARIEAVHGELPRSRAVVGIGRLAGRGYLLAATLRERGRIFRARTPDRLEPVRTSFALIQLQRGLFLWLGLLIVTGLAADKLIPILWSATIEHLAIGDWLRSHLSKPSSETLRNLLAASAGGTATILGLVLSISLIVWQATADRYRSSTIIGFLLRERLGSAVVRLLALAFAYSLWVLALLEVLAFRPYASAALALVLSTAAVLSLISYRELGLVGYLPRSIARSLRHEIVREALRAQRISPGRSVETYSRQVVEADLQIFHDLVVRLRADNEMLDLSACLEELNASLSTYLRLKRRFAPESMFFVHRKERLGPSAYAIEEAIGAQGLMSPTTEVPDHLWFEKRLLDVTDLIVSPTVLGHPNIAIALVELWGSAVQYAWYGEDIDAFELIFSRIEAGASGQYFRATERVAEELLTLPWVIIEAAAAGFSVTPEAVVNREPWKGDDRIRELPWKAQEDARELARQIRSELAIAGSVVTPKHAMITEVASRREPRLAELQAQVVPRAIALARSQLSRAVEERSSATATVAQMLIRVLLRTVHHGLAVPSLDGLAGELIAVTSLSDQQQIEDLQAASGRAARVLAQQEAWPLAYELLRVSEVTGLIARSQAIEETKQLHQFYDSLFTAAVVYAWGEFYGRTDHVRTVGQYVQSPFADLDVLATSAEEHRLTQFFFPTVVHYQWTQPLSMAADALDDVPLFDGGFGFSLQKDHPSGLFAESHMLGVGPTDALEHLLKAVKDDRTAARQNLLTVLARGIAKRSSP